MKIAVISDLHIDANPWNWNLLDQIIEQTDTIVVAGDISNDVDQTCRWIVDLKKLFDHVIWVAGNHDFYNLGFHKTKMVPSIEWREKWPTPCTVPEIYDHYARWSREYGIHFLNRSSIDINGVKFAGVTGWHDFRAGSPFTQEDQIHHWYRYLNDSRHVKWDNTAVNHTSVLTAAELDSMYIQTIAEQTDVPLVVISHHLPRQEFAVDKPHDMIWTKLNGSFVNTLFENISNSNLKYWIYGHTHFRSLKQIGETTYVCNPRGYPNENSRWEPIIIDL